MLMLMQLVNPPPPSSATGPLLPETAPGRNSLRLKLNKCSSCPAKTNANQLINFHKKKKTHGLSVNARIRPHCPNTDKDQFWYCARPLPASPSRLKLHPLSEARSNRHKPQTRKQARVAAAKGAKLKVGKPNQSKVK
ncbi:hypothetical protein J3458_000068 [Metarhizium acridum]|uniref:uncharacterized protein n=1 Tax=Metarhizium acridum TaxID=92637 RepID=UPI001C6C53CF|nr:hypothetical protein J3458_000068 [Metarhizium acridum]